MEHDELATRWERGEPVTGVVFARGAHVRILEGPFAEEDARVIGLVALTPEPCYTIEIDAAHVRLELAQSALVAD